MWISDALVAQPDRASDYESEGRRFESCRARHSNYSICRSFCCNSALRAANLFGSDRNVTGVGSPVGPFEAPKSGSPGVSAACSKVDFRWDEKADPRAAV